MKSKRKKTYYRRFKTGAMNHIYQRTVSRGILFYSEIDALVCLSAIYVMAKRYDITIIAICFMVDHIHLLVYTDSKDKMSIFVQEYTSVFARKYNISISREGAVFEPRFGSAPKVSDKEIRTYFKNIFGFRIRHVNLFRTALMHRSLRGLSPIGHRENNERLEYLGDAVLGAIVADFLCRKYPSDRKSVV